MDTKNQVLTFLQKYSMAPENIDLHSCTMAFCRELQAGLEGKESSLMMIPTYISPRCGSLVGKTAIAIDAGGTNMRTALVSFTETGAVISDFELSPMPGTETRISRRDFYDAVIARIEPLAGKADSIGFCFSYPAEILPNRDARVIRFNKEVRIDDSEGMILCAPLKERFADKAFVVLNDTVAAQLGSDSGLAADIGFILGTGTNTCYSEKGENIKKLPGTTGKMIINTESAGFDKFPLGEFERRFDETTAIPGDHLYEKAVSGAYHSGIIYLTALQAGKDGLLDSKTLAAIEACGGFNGVEVDEFARNPDGNGKIASLSSTEQDREVLYHIVDCAMERAARLVTANLAGVMLQADLGKDSPAVISAEGSTFLKSFLLRPKVEQYIKSYIEQQLGRRCVFVTGRDVNLVGAAAAAIIAGN
ncbi:MAG: hexokinase [Ruminococcaceae bacterium]|nr:hexokinase [Oscillospiraceae bacterium]